MFKGVMVAMATPFNDEGCLNVPQVGKLVEYFEKTGVHGFFVGGTGGEGILLSNEERKALLDEVMHVKKPESQVIVHCSAFHESDVPEILHHAKTAGADAVALLPPGYFSPLDDEAVFRYFERMCAMAEIPVMIYHLPAYSHFHIIYDLFDRLMRIENLIGIKDSNGAVHEIFRFIHHPSNPIVFNGIDFVNLASLGNGAQGMISAPANVMPKQYVELWNAMQRGDLTAASSAQQQINALWTEISPYPFVPALKQIMEWQGHSTGKPRNPARELTVAEQNELHNRLEKINFL